MNLEISEMSKCEGTEGQPELTGRNYYSYNAPNKTQLKPSLETYIEQTD